MIISWSAIHIATLIVVTFAAGYFFLEVALGVRELRKQRVRLDFQAGVDFGAPFEPLPGTPPPSGYSVYFLVACLNEATVIGDTVAALRDPNGIARIVVIDDGSDDDTGALAAGAGGTRVTVVRRELPNARMGKGAALNAGFAYVLGDVAARGLDHDSVIICVMDADGRLSNGALAEVLPQFADLRIGGVQLPVRIRNRSTNFLLRFQEHQFWTQSALTQFGRMATQTVSLGGNGQFTRLSALLEIGDAPWSASLTEDLDLMISLALRGWRTTSAPRAAVDQQGVERLRPLLRQRTRWYQGHMLAMKRFPEVVRSPRVPTLATVEIGLYLSVPWLLDLPWSVLYHFALFEIVSDLKLDPWIGSSLSTAVAAVVTWYLLSFWPALIASALARRRDPEISRRQALLRGHSFVVTNYLSYVCAWRALSRIVRRRNGWTKTARVSEASLSQATPAPSLV